MQAATEAPSPGATIDNAWRSALAAWVRSRRRYPDEARGQGAEGQVAVRFTVARDGKVLDAQIVRGSGWDVLDQTALTMFRGAHAPPFPAEMTQPKVTTATSIRFRLDE
jgi:periplasmic protein TonB